MNPVDTFVNNYTAEKKEWLATFVDFMRAEFPEAQEVISYQIPTYRFGKMYIAFSVAKEHFTFHTLDFEMIEALKSLLPKAKFGRGSAKVRFNDREYIPVLQQMAHKIVARTKGND